MRFFSIAALLVAVYPLSAVESVLPEGDGRFNDDPSMTRAADGSLYVAWNGFRDNADALVLARYQYAGGQFRKLGSWEILGGKGTYVLGPKVVATADGVAVLYAAEHGRAWDIVALPCTEKGAGRPVTVVADGAANIKPDGAWRGDTLYVTWESNRGGTRAIRLATVRNGRAAPAEDVSTGRSNYGPSIAVESNGGVAVAWHSFRENNYDIYLRRRAKSGDWTPERRLTSAPTMDRHVALALNKDDLWAFWENSQFDGYKTGMSIRRKVVAAKVTAHGLEAPPQFDAAPAYQRGEAASPAFDASGRLWLAYLKTRPNDGWEVWFTGFNGTTWAPAKTVSDAKAKGFDRRPAVVIEGDTAILAYQTDNIVGRPTSRAIAIAESVSQIRLAAIDLRDMPSAAPQPLVPLVESAARFEAGELRVQYGEDNGQRTIDYGGSKLKLLYGDLHTHSDISVCQRCTNQSVDENYQVRRDLHNLDFSCMTDHGYNQLPYHWYYTAKMARANEDEGRMMTFLAQEWTSEFKKPDPQHPYGFYGHRNIILADPFFPRWWNAREAQTPAQVWAELDQLKANFVNIPHQLADTGNVPTDWTFTDENKQPVAEIFQARGSYEYWEAPRQAQRTVPKPGWFIQDAWARGVVIGVIASPDHAGGLGKACVYSPSLTREAILDAIRRRHTFGTTAARIFLEVRVNGHLMGEKLPASDGKPVEVKVSAQCPGDIDRIEICRNNQFVYTKKPEGRNADFQFVDTAPVKGFSYYYVRVVQKDAEMAWSSPVWLGTYQSP